MALAALLREGSRPRRAPTGGHLRFGQETCEGSGEETAGQVSSQAPEDRVFTSAMGILKKLARKSPLLDRFYRRTRALKLRWRHRNLPRHITLGPHTLDVGGDIGMRRNYLAGDYFDGFEKVLADHVEPGDVVLDIGAHVGVTATYISERVGPHGRVHAIEPTPHLFETIRSNIARNSIDNIEPHQLAISRTDGSTTIYTNALHSGFNSIARTNAEIFHGTSKTISSVEVQALTLDTFLDRIGAFPRLIKIDCQGAEYEIFSGAKGLTTSKRPTDLFVYTEFWPQAIENSSAIEATEFLDLIARLGFEVIDAEDFLEEIRNNDTLSRDERQRFVDDVSALSRGYTNLLLR
ncbi:MAG TPA: FkbM family methyltransferase, partial [Planctomycetes bacterium]|nr:FkbM family methyltransferase [Planctomycetota bacterium]